MTNLPTHIEVSVGTSPDGVTEVGTNVDPYLSAKVLIEGLGALIPEIVRWSATKPFELKASAHNMTRGELLKNLHEYLDQVANDYSTKRMVYSPFQLDDVLGEDTNTQ